MEKKCENNGPESVISSMSEEVAPPRKNGELQFQEPWENRSFGMAIALYQEKRYSTWEDFRSRLIEEIQAWEKSEKKEDTEWNYYEHWLSALERLVLETGLLNKHDVDTRTNEFLTGKRDEVFY
ncbi:nitrile hydratase accessory protein [Alkalihalobacterium alkalinitrilicum]|uniref:nitrile hydratase accessory protein n=1 Tax=Alkalihalobacterium alkalinitrilicum TaxID=427920 RepID=UPI00099531D1|nr:nitrile hydratase accessory protein [Alkalihalobacterium alkalinitrilicum]